MYETLNALPENAIANVIVKGPKCFEDLRTIDGIEHETFHTACLALGLLENDNQWNETLKEAKECNSPAKIRTPLAIILLFCEPSNPNALWESDRDCQSQSQVKHILFQQDLRIVCIKQFPIDCIAKILTWH